jgi:hypothetical protein
VGIAHGTIGGLRELGMTEQVNIDARGPIAHEAAAMVRRLILARREADAVGGIYQMYFETVTEAVNRTLVDDDQHDLRERSEYLAAVLSSFSWTVSRLATKAAAAEDDAVMAQSSEQTWEYLRAFVEDLEAHGITF